MSADLCPPTALQRQYLGGDGPHSALFLGHHKLMKVYEDGRLALFDIEADISEQNDLSQQMSQKVK